MGNAKEELAKGVCAMLAAMAEESDGTKANIREFESEEEAIEHAVRIAELKPGDIFLNDEFGKVVFFRVEDDGGRLEGFYFDEEDRKIHRGCFPAGSVSFPESKTFTLNG